MLHRSIPLLKDRFSISSSRRESVRTALYHNNQVLVTKADGETTFNSLNSIDQWITHNAHCNSGPTIHLVADLCVCFCVCLCVYCIALHWKGNCFVNISRENRQNKKRQSHTTNTGKIIAHWETCSLRKEKLPFASSAKFHCYRCIYVESFCILLWSGICCYA